MQCRQRKWLNVPVYNNLFPVVFAASLKKNSLNQNVGRQISIHDLRSPNVLFVTKIHDNKFFRLEPFEHPPNQRGEIIKTFRWDIDKL